MFQSGITSTDDSLIDGLFGDKNPGADNLLGGEKKEEKKVETSQEPTPGAKKVETNVEPVNTNTASEEEVADLLFGETKEEVKGSEPSKKETAKLPETAEVNYEAIYNDMVAQGIWEEVEVPEGTEWNKDTFIQIQKLQAESKYDDLLSKTGPYGKAIIEYEQNGGNPGELLNLFREQREIQTFDISDSEGQEVFLRSFLEAQGNSEKSIERTITLLKDQGGTVLQEEAEEKKQIWDEQYKEQIENTKKEQVLLNKQREEAEKNFQKNITTTLQSDTDISLKERKELQNYMLNYTQSFRGKQVSQFYLDMAEIQKDPKNYVELAKFIKGIKTGEYVKKVADKVKKETAVASYIKIKAGAALRNNTGTDPSVSQPDKTSSFISFLKK